MAQIIYSIVRDKQLIFAQNFQYNTKEEAQKDLKSQYNAIKALTDKGIKDMSYNSNELKFTTYMEGESDETHNYIIKEV